MTQLKNSATSIVFGIAKKSSKSILAIKIIYSALKLTTHVLPTSVDDVFLLQFLRTKKYSMDRVFNTFENYILAQKKYAKWFDFKDDDFDKMMELYRTGYIYPLAKRDEEGRKLIFIQLRKLNPDYFTSADAIR